MKKLLVAFAVCIGVMCIPLMANAWTVLIAWDVNTEPDLDHYTLYHNGDKLSDIVKVGEVLPTSYVHENVGAGVHTYNLSASDVSGNESNKSNSAVQPLIRFQITITGTALVQ